jgi:hypothetical protein
MKIIIKKLTILLLIAPLIFSSTEQFKIVCDQFKAEGYTALQSGDLDKINALDSRNSACNLGTLEVLDLYQTTQKNKELSDSQKELLLLFRLSAATTHVSCDKNRSITQVITQYKPLKSLSKKRRICELYLASVRERLTDLISSQTNDKIVQLKNPELLSTYSLLLANPLAKNLALKTILLSCLERAIPLLIKLRRREEKKSYEINLFYKPVNNKYVLTHPDNYSYSQALLVIDGFSRGPKDDTYIQEIGCKIQEILDTDNDQLVITNTDTDYTYDLGTFVINRIYAQTVGNIMQKPQLAANQLRRAEIYKAVPFPSDLVQLICQYDQLKL